MNIKTILKDFDEQFVKEPVDWRENHEWTIPYVDSRADKVKTFLLTSLLSVLKEQREEIVKIINKNCYTNDFGDTIDDADKLIKEIQNYE